MTRPAAGADRWDWIIVGSGFGGSVCALRLAEKGWRVLVLEQGRRFRAEDFPRTNWNLRRWLWAPRLGLRGPFRVDFLRHVTVLSGVGVGGGSLVYANTLVEPGGAFYDADAWRGLADWRRELAPHYATARRMLGAVPFPGRTWADDVFRELADDLGADAAWAPADVAVYFGAPGVRAPDPYFGGAGPERTGCTHCGGCMLGCRVGAKNTLDRNYLWLAERRGVTVRALTQVTWIRPDAGGYEVEARTGYGLVRRRSVHHARRVILAGGVLGTVPLLLRLARSADGLPKLSPRLGDFVRTNTEVLVGITTPPGPRDASDGIAITSTLRIGSEATLEPVRFPPGAGAFRVLQMPHAPGHGLRQRLAAGGRRFLDDPLGHVRAWLTGDWARRTLILLYMRTGDAHLSLRPGRVRSVTSRATAGRAPAAYVPEATGLADRVAARMGGVPLSLATETLLGVPTTAHMLGGCVMGDSPGTGVIDAAHQVWNYPGLFVVDGSALSANPGVNPALTICALAERAMAAVPWTETARVLETAAARPQY